MKKFYTLALAAAVALSVSARDMVNVSELSASKLPRLHVVENTIKGESLPLANKFQKAPARIAAEDVFGEYVWEYLDLISMEDQADAIEILQSSDDPTVAGLAGIMNEPIIGAFDANAATMTITPYVIGDVKASVNGVQTTLSAQVVIMKIDANDEWAPTTDPFVITFDGKTGSVAEDLVFAIAGVDKSTNEVRGWFACSAFNLFTKDTWTNVGEATFVDGILPVFFTEENETPVAVTSTVTVMRNDTNPNLLRVLNPWTGTFDKVFPGEDDNSSYPFELDITDPEYVCMSLTATGVSGQGFSIYIGTLNCLGFKTKADFLASQYAANNVTLSGNVITFAPGAIGVVYTDEPTKLYLSGSLESSITLPEGWSEANGVESVEISASAPVEYFNLQGVRVANPENGIYIRRQGTNATKVFVK